MSRTGKVETIRARLAASAKRCREAATEAEDRGNQTAHLSLSTRAETWDQAVKIVDSVMKG